MAGEDRGGAWVAAQVPLLVAAAVAPQAGPRWPGALAAPSRLVGGALLVTGAYFILRGFRDLGRNLTPFPKPKADATLVRHGIYSVVRHPIYTGLIAASWGWSLASANTTRVLLALAVALFFDAKSRREEVWLTARYPEYPAYRDQVRKLLPGLY